MCRVSGIISQHLTIAQLRQDVKQMNACMQHGGPDGEGIHIDEKNGFGFGHRRLSILDLTAAGHQPMLTPDENLVITFNGEIYNYPSLKVELEQTGYSFQSNCDTEVILAAYQMWGTASFGRLEGMFAFAIFDKAGQNTYLVRDRGGIKPLYYHINAQRLTFASEVKAFKETSFSHAINEQWKVLFLAFGHLPEPHTTLKDVLMLQKGHYLAWNHQTSTATKAIFATAGYQTIIKTESLAQNAVQESLKTAVKSHLLADAPIGVFLSGGIDSSLLTLLTDELIGEKLNTVSINFDEQKFSEARYQQLVSEQTKGKHQSYLIKEADFLENFDEAVAAMDQPTQDGINSWYVSKCAKDSGLKAVLSGVGADELFGGYPSFKRITLAKKIQALPNGMLRLLAKLPDAKFQRLFYLTYKSPIGLYLFLRGSFTPQWIAKILNMELPDIEKILTAVQIDPIFNTLTDSQQACYLESNLYMQNQLLKDTDCMSMAHGIEVRVPFLDQQLVKNISQIDDVLLYQNQLPKKLLIDSFKYLLPSAIRNRPKMGFTFPFEKWLLKIDALTTPDIYKNNVPALQLISRFKKGKLHWAKAMLLYQVFKS